MIEGPFTFQLASDIQRDGLGVELSTDAGILAEVFRCDADHTLTFTAYTQDIPLTAVEELIMHARSRLGTFEDGSPLPRTVTSSSKEGDRATE